MADTFTLELWVNLDSLPTAGNFYSLIARGTGAADTFALDVDSNGVVSFFAGGGPTQIASSSAVLSPNGGWYHVVATKSGSSRAIYLNKSNVTVLGTNAIVGTGSDGIDIGRYGGAEYVDGQIDEVAIYPTALSAERVAAHYDAAFGVVATPEFRATVLALAPVAWWRFGDQT
jgi:hypothetical protein